MGERRKSGERIEERWEIDQERKKEERRDSRKGTQRLGGRGVRRKRGEGR